MFFILFSFFCGYLSGSVPYGLLLGQLSGLGDIRKSGSGNIGATNVLRLGGTKLAILTLIFDALKGTVPVLIAINIKMDYAVFVALGAFIGHIFPVWLQFKGGKGVAVALGIAFAFSLKLGFALCLVWFATALITRYSSLSALIAFAFAPIVAGLVVGHYQVTAVMFFIAIMVWVKHHENIKRLLAGTESRIDLKKNK